MIRGLARLWGVLLVGVVALGFYVQAVRHLNPMPRTQDPVEMAVVVPAGVQAVLLGGDRYLAANASVYRALVLTTGDLDPPTATVLGKVHREAARLNPYHEDNYYVGQAVLPWYGQVQPMQEVLAAASETRTWDMLPPFFRGFNHYYFDKDPVTAGRWLERAAARADASNAGSLRAIAAKWYEQTFDPRVGLNILRVMAKDARDPKMKSVLEQRALRLERLLELQAAAATFQARHGRAITSLQELVTEGLIRALPVDPLGQGYRVGPKGVPEIAYRFPLRQDGP